MKFSKRHSVILVLAISCCIILALLISPSFKVINPDDPSFDATKFSFRDYFPAKCYDYEVYPDHRECGEDLIKAIHRICKEYPTQAAFEKIIVGHAKAKKREYNHYPKDWPKNTKKYFYKYESFLSRGSVDYQPNFWPLKYLVVPPVFITATYEDNKIASVGVAPYGRMGMTIWGVKACPEINLYGIFID